MDRNTPRQNIFIIPLSLLSGKKIFITTFFNYTG